MPYIPAILVTLYDGYYIYSPSEYVYNTAEGQITGYKHVLKPYVYYSAKYVSGNNWVVVNYSLDNYITIEGIVNGEVVSNAGYLGTNILNDIDENASESLSEIIVYRVRKKDETTNTYYYEYHNENLKNKYIYVYNEGRKVYNITDLEENSGWYYLNDLDLQEAKDFSSNGLDTSAEEYIKSAKQFNNWLSNNYIGQKVVSLVTPENAINGATGQKYSEFSGDTTQILKEDPESLASAFNQHKREVIRLSIQDNLNNAMAIYNANSAAMGVDATFVMPKLSELDWDKILNNVNFVTFMQGVPVGNKIYNNYSIVSSNNNKQYINPNSIYFTYGNEYHTINHIIKMSNEVSSNTQNLKGYKSFDFERVKYEKNDEYKYYYKRPEYACYSCIVDYSINADDKINLSEANDIIKKVYYTALARERLNLDKVTKKLINYNSTT